MATKTVVEIVSEVLNSLNSELPKVATKEEAADILQSSINRAFTYSKDPIEKQNKLRFALQFKFAQDKLQNIDQPYAKFLIEKQWAELAQSILNNAKQLSKDLIIAKEEPEFKRPVSIDERLNNFIINTWSHEGVSPLYLRGANIITQFSLLVYLHYSIIVLSGILPWLGYLFADDAHDKLLQKEADLLSEELKEFETDFPEAYAEIKTKIIDDIKRLYYTKSINQTLINSLNATTEDLNKANYEVFELLYVKIKSNEEFIELNRQNIMVTLELAPEDVEANEAWNEFENITAQLNNASEIQKANKEEMDIMGKIWSEKLAAWKLYAEKIATQQNDDYFNLALKKGILASGANSATFAGKALFNVIKSPLTGNPLQIIGILLYRSLLLLLTIVIPTLLLSLKIMRSVILDPLKYILPNLIDATVTLALLTISTPLIAKQGVQSLWAKLTTTTKAGEVPQVDPEETCGNEMQAKNPALYSNNFFERKLITCKQATAEPLSTKQNVVIFT